MSKISQKKDAEIRRQIQLALAKDPMLTVARLQRVLFDIGYKSTEGNVLNAKYVFKTLAKVRTEGLRDIDDKKINERMMESRNRFNASFMDLAKIAYWQWEYLKEGIPMPTIQERAIAHKIMMEMDLKLLQAEMDAGIYKRDLGTIDLELQRRNAPLTVERKAQIVTALKAWGLVAPPKQIESVQPVESPIQNANTTNTTTTNA